MKQTLPAAMTRCMQPVCKRTVSTVQPNLTVHWGFKRPHFTKAFMGQAAFLTTKGSSLFLSKCQH